MAAETEKEVGLEIAHVLFIDIVGYSKLLIDEQRDYLHTLNEVVRETDSFRAAEAAGKLTRLPTGDGMALVFATTPDAPVSCALQISKALRSHPEVQVRMGIHSGPVSGITDVNDRSNVAGAGINLAQRVMDCGDAGHILLSRHVAEDLEQYRQWQPCLHDLGECEVKHGVRVAIANLYDSEIGNSQLPKKLQAVKKHHAHVRWAAVAIGLLVVAALAAGVLFFLRKGPARSLATAVDKSIAVLPFENLSRDPDNAFFTDGVQDEILTDLARIADLKVISRTSVMHYRSGIARNLREIGEQLGVAHVLEGSVQRSGNRVRVNAQLVDARTDRHLWAQTYDRDLADVFAIQSEIAKIIADQLRAKLSPQEKAALASQPTQDTDAYDLYLRAKELMHSTSSYEPGSVEIFSNSVNLLEKAVARDPNFSLAYCLLAEANLSLYWRYESVLGARERAEVALEAARRLAPEAGETHLAEALFFYWGKRDYDHALESLEKAARSSPNNVDVFRFTALVERRLGRWAESIRHELRAVELDPLDWHPRDELISTYLLVRDYSAAERLADHAIADFPDRADYFRAIKAEAAFDRGDLKAARACLATLSVPDYSAWQLWATALYERNYDEAARLVNVWTERHEPDDAALPRSWMQALTARAAGKSETARAAFLVAQQHYTALLRDRNDQPRLLSYLAIVDAALGRKEEALQEGRRAVEMLPISRDAVYGPEMLGNLALVYSWVGERDRAIEQLSSVVSLPGSAPSYGELKLDPRWDDLRGDPRFQKLVTSTAPQAVPKK